MTIITFPDPRMKWYPEVYVEFLKDDASRKALLDALESGDYSDVMLLRTLLFLVTDHNVGWFLYFEFSHIKTNGMYVHAVPEEGRAS